jgi:hypothetical protein
MMANQNATFATDKNQMNTDKTKEGFSYLRSSDWHLWLFCIGFGCDLRRVCHTLLAAVGR